MVKLSFDFGLLLAKLSDEVNVQILELVLNRELEVLHFFVEGFVDDSADVHGDLKLNINYAFHLLWRWPPLHVLVNVHRLRFWLHHLRGLLLELS